MKVRIYLAVAAALCMAALTTEAQQQAPRDSTYQGNQTDPAQYPTGARLSNAEVLGVVATMDSAEINAANLILGEEDTVNPSDDTGWMDNGNDVDRNGNDNDSERSDPMDNHTGTTDTGRYDTNPPSTDHTFNVSDETRDFARMIKQDHAKNIEQVRDVAQQIGVQVSMNSQKARTMKQKANQDLQQLKAKQDDQFEQAFINGMVRDHRQALQTIDNQLMPATTNQQVKDCLTKTRKAVQQHLERAQELQGKVSMNR